MRETESLLHEIWPVFVPRCLGGKVSHPKSTPSGGSQTEVRPNQTKKLNPTLDLGCRTLFVSFVPFCSKSVFIFTTFHVVLAAPKPCGGGPALRSLLARHSFSDGGGEGGCPSVASTIFNFSLLIFDWQIHTPFNAHSRLLTAINAHSSPPPPPGVFFQRLEFKLFHVRRGSACPSRPFKEFQGDSRRFKGFWRKKDSFLPRPRAQNYVV